MITDSVADDIAQLVQTVGRDAVRRRYTNTGNAYDPTRTPADAPIVAAVVAYKAHQIGAGGIQMQDRKAYITADEPMLSTDKVLDGGVEYNIVHLREVRPGDETLVYIAQLRA